MRSRNRRWLYSWIILWTYLQLLYCEANDFRNPTNNRNGSNFNKEIRGLFSPRMDYEQWKPILNGDPLKNDPTFDYVPPMVEAVRYWRDTSHRNPENHQTSTTNQNQKKDILILGVSSKKPSTLTSISDNPNRREYFDPFSKYVKDNPYKETPFKDTTYTYQRYRQSLPITSPYFTPSNFLHKLTERPPIDNNEAIPYTMLLPPPVPSPAIPESTKKPFQPSTSDVTIDQASLIFQSSTSGLTDWLINKHTTAESSNVVTWKTPPSQEPILSNVIDKHEKPSEFFDGNKSNEIPLKMHKGQVEDDDLDTYVNIGKLEAHMDSVSGIGISGVTIKPPKFSEILRPISVPNLNKAVNPAFLHTMQTMQPPPISMGNEITQSSDLPTTMMITITPKPTAITTTPPKLTPKPTTTTASSLTTDPLFKHYKQSMEPIRGPLYLIIQGHSKVKTYGPSKQIHGIAIQDSNEIPLIDDKKLNVKHLHKLRKEGESNSSRRNGRSNDLQTLKHVVQTRLGAIDFGKIDFKEIDREVEYKVSSQENDNASEKYQKGIVEAGAMARKLKND